MTIELKPEHQRTIDLAIQSGAYHDKDEVLDQAFEIIREQLHLEDWMSGNREALASQVAVGFAQAERGDLIDGEIAVVAILHGKQDLQEIVKNRPI
jgi:Arc/MetJ-type ribon-helix-helix transcriptional regulator